MSRTNNFLKMVFSALLVVSIILVNVSVAFADDGTPPPETPTTEPTEEVVETETVTHIREQETLEKRQGELEFDK